jgi:hypothetical protein
MSNFNSCVSNINRVARMLREVEDERSLKCDFEMKAERDNEVAALKAKGLDEEAKALAGVDEDYRAAVDLQDQWKRDAEQFEPEKRKTKADEENDLR